MVLTRHLLACGSAASEQEDEQSHDEASVELVPGKAHQQDGSERMHAAEPEASGVWELGATSEEGYRVRATYPHTASTVYQLKPLPVQLAL